MNRIRINLNPTELELLYNDLVAKYPIDKIEIENNKSTDANLKLTGAEILLIITTVKDILDISDVILNWMKYLKKETITIKSSDASKEVSINSKMTIEDVSNLIENLKD